MAKDPFTEQFQLALQNEMQQLFDSTWAMEGFTTKCEYSKVDMLGAFNQYVDIGIRDEDNEHAFIGVEIEHLSSYDQAMKNIRKLKAWTHNSSKRKCGLLQLFNEKCNLEEKDILKLRGYAHENEMKGHGFYYDYAFYMPRNRLPETVAREVINSKDFRTRLYQLLKHVDSCI